MLRQYLRRLKHSRGQQQTLAAIAGLWMTTFTLWHYKEAVKNNVRGDYYYGKKGPVHEVVEKWHLDGEKLPVLNSMKDEKWLTYPDSELFTWTEPTFDESADTDSPGALGSPVILPPELRKEAKRKNSIHQLNVVASNHMNINRTLKDYRNSMCKNVVYPSRLPRMSIIIVFHNEALSTLLRTAFSAANRAPPELVREVIFVDDNSSTEELTNPDLESKLQAWLPKGVSSRVLRSGNVRLGLIRARMMGAEVAKGPVLVFFDAHIEATPGWAVPMLAEVAGDRTRVAMPVIDGLSHSDFSYSPVPDDHERGGMDWKMLHSWIGSHGAREVAEGQLETDAFPTAFLIGCAIVIDKEFFYASGTYDNRMKVWGGENVEMSVRVWRCGGSLMKVPCSRIAHVYRPQSPHSLPNDGTAMGMIKAKADTVVANTARFVEAWIEQEPYKSFYYYMNPAAKNVDLGPLAERVGIRDRLQCHSFQWYLDHVYPQHNFPRVDEDNYFGQIQNLGDGLCLEAEGTRGPPRMRQCHGLGGFQSILLTQSGQLRSASRCLEPYDEEKTEPGGNVTFVNCDQSQRQNWEFQTENEHQKTGRLIHPQSGLCLVHKGSKQEVRRPKMVLKYLANLVKDVAQKSEQAGPVLAECSEQYEQQIWALNGEADWKTGHGNLILQQQESQ